MTQEEFDDLIRAKLEFLEEDYNFIFKHACLFRNRNIGFRDVISFDYDGKHSFRILVGINYPFDEKEIDLESPPVGARLVSFFTGGSLSAKPRDFHFKGSSDIEKHLSRFKDYFIRTLNKEYFDRINSPDKYADSLTDVDCITKYKIYKMIGFTQKALDQAEIILNKYEKMRDIPKIEKFLKGEVQPYLAEHRSTK